MLENEKETRAKRLPGRATKTGIFLFLLIAVLVQGVAAKDIVVPDQHMTIGEAIDAASFGDTVYVKPGRYSERIEMKEGVSLVSFAGTDGNELVDGPGNKKVLKRTVRTIIDGAGIEAPGYLVSFPKDTTAPMKLDGFTIMNMPKYVSGINLFLMEVRGCSPEVVNNIVTKNRSWGGILSYLMGRILLPWWRIMKYSIIGFLMPRTKTLTHPGLG